MSAPGDGVTRWRGRCAYDGTDFSGWQSQPDGNAVQDHLEARLAVMFGGRVVAHGSGRTDAGVHALAQVFHFDAAWGHGSERLRAALQTGLPEAIQIRDIREADADFHARFSARGKCYAYDIARTRTSPFAARYCWPLGRALDVAAMRAAAEGLCGRHDFRAFAALNGAPREDTVRDLRRLAVLERGPRLRVVAEADGFLYKMVRSLVGTLVAVGLGRLRPGEVLELRDAGRRVPAMQTAPARGLFLRRVYY